MLSERPNAVIQEGKNVKVEGVEIKVSSAITLTLTKDIVLKILELKKEGKNPCIDVISDTDIITVMVNDISLITEK